MIKYMTHKYNTHTTHKHSPANGYFNIRRNQVYSQLSRIITLHKGEFIMNNRLSITDISNVVYSEMYIIEDDRYSLSDRIRFLTQRGYLGLFEITVDMNPKATHSNDIGKGVVILDDGTLTLPVGMYFSKKHINKYKTYLQTLFNRIFGDRHSFCVNDIIEVETWLSTIYIPGNTDIRLIKKTSAHRVFSEYGIDLEYILNMSDTKKQDPIMICNPDGFDKITDMLLSYNNMNKLRSYWAYRIITTYYWTVYDISSIVYDFLMNIYNISNHPINVAYNMAYRPYALSKYYHTTFMYKSNNDLCKKICSMYVDTYINAIVSNTWLSEVTKRECITKLQQVKFIIGYKTNINLDVPYYERVDPISGLIDHNLKRYQRMCSEIGTKIVTNMTSYTVNAFNNIIENAIYIPTALLMPPIFNVDKDIVYNISRLGFIIGHELSHCLDNIGILYDSTKIYHKDTFLNKSELVIFTNRINSIYNYVMVNSSTDGLDLSKTDFIHEILADITGFLLCENILCQYVQVNHLNLRDILNSFYTQYTHLWNTHRDTSMYMDVHLPDKYRIELVMMSSKHYQTIHNKSKAYDSVFI